MQRGLCRVWSLLCVLPWFKKWFTLRIDGWKTFFLCSPQFSGLFGTLIWVSLPCTSPITSGKESFLGMVVLRRWTWTKVEGMPAAICCHGTFSKMSQIYHGIPCKYIFPPLPTWYNVLLNVSVAGNHYANIPFRDMIAWIVHESVDGMYVPGNTWHFSSCHENCDTSSTIEMMNSLDPNFLTVVTYRRGYVCEVQVRQWKFYMMGPKTFLLKVLCLYIQYLFCLTAIWYSDLKWCENDKTNTRNYLVIPSLGGSFLNRKLPFEVQKSAPIFITLDVIPNKIQTGTTSSCLISITTKKILQSLPVFSGCYSSCWGKGKSPHPAIVTSRSKVNRGTEEKLHSRNKREKSRMPRLGLVGEYGTGLWRVI